MTVLLLGEPPRILMRVSNGCRRVPPEGMACMAEPVMAGEGRHLKRALATERQRG
jgi:hypothetical protein